ncbi:MAG: Glu/Leu/Phe/Val dehydrogenase dimerization domain-containing protein [Candidatus Sungiibacteriota bacterium]
MTKRDIAIEELPEFEGHKLVSFIYDKRVGLRGFIAIHNTNLGPATGGTRYWIYDSEKDALSDALRLSKAMTYKCALAGVSYGGGKGVIIRNPRRPKNDALLQAYAHAVNLFNGSFYTGEDVGMTEHDVEFLAGHCKFINGLPGRAGDPAPWAALGVFHAIEASLHAVFGTAAMEGRTFAIKGLGKLGSELARLIFEQGGEVYGADISADAVKKAVKRFPKLKIIKAAEIHTIKADVFSPCALGGDFNGKTIPQLKSDIVCGGANNQLVSAQDGARLQERGILYIPDYVANAGGLISVTEEWNRAGYRVENVRRKVAAIRKTVTHIIEKSRKDHAPTSVVADRLAEDIFLGGKAPVITDNPSVMFVAHEAQEVAPIV